MAERASTSARSAQSWSSADHPEKLSTVPILSSVLKKDLRLSTLPALMSSRTPLPGKGFQFFRQAGEGFGDGLG